MAKTRLVIQISEPFDFARMNGGSAELVGWTAQASPAFPDWVVRLDAPARLADETFEKIKLSPRYAGETVAKVLDGFGYTAVNICYPRLDEDGRPFWHFGMVGSIRLAPEEG